MDNLLNKAGNSLMGFVLDTFAFLEQVLDFLLSTEKMVSQFAAFLLIEVASLLPSVAFNSKVTDSFFKLVASSLAVLVFLFPFVAFFSEVVDF
jgi:hypothetical protein